MRDIEGNHAKAKATQAFEIQSIPEFNGGQPVPEPGSVRVSNGGEVTNAALGPEGAQKGLNVVEGAEGGLEAKGEDQVPKVSKIPRPGSRRSSRSPSPEDMDFILGEDNTKNKGNDKIKDKGNVKSKDKGNVKNKESKGINKETKAQKSCL